MTKEDEHHWSGWPGAYCLKCMCDDPMEVALADGDFDFVGDTSKSEETEIVWKSEELKAKVEAANICPVKGTLVYNTETKKWDLHRSATAP